MTLLRIQLFGTVQIEHEGLSYRCKVTRTVQALLAYLVLHRHRGHSREALAGLFWGDLPESRAHSCLNTALWRLRGVLEPAGVQRGTYLVTTPSDGVGFNCGAPYWLDVEAFEGQAAQVLEKSIENMSADDVAQLEGALLLYTGDFLEGSFESWALRERERLSLLYLSALTHLMRYYWLHQAYDQSLACGRRILDHDPLREEIHRDMMEIYLAAGQRALAIRQYELCRRVLAEELGIAPMEETQALYAQLVTARPGLSGASSADFAHGPAEYQQVIRQLNSAMQTVEAMRQQLSSLARLVEHLTEGAVVAAPSTNGSTTGSSNESLFTKQKHRR